MTSNPGHGGSPSIALQDDYWWYSGRAEMLRAFLSPYAAAGATVLDIGSADAPSASWVRETAGQHVSLDIDPRGLSGDAVCGSALALPFADGSVDVVCAFDVIEHLEDEAGALAEIRRVLRPGGYLFLSVPAYMWAWSDHDVANGHVRRYTRRSAVRALTAGGFAVQRSSHAFAGVFPFFAAERLVRRLTVRREEAADIVEVPTVSAPVDRLLRTLCRVDTWALRRRTLPFGSSVFAVGRRD